MSHAASPLHDRMVFVVGARRSGTNWLQRILAAHSDVAAIPSETYLFSHGLAPLRERFHHGVLTSSGTGAMYISPSVLADALRDFCDVVFGEFVGTIAPDARYIVERTPDHVRQLELIAEVYPDARIAHIIRDGRDVVRSLLSMDWGPTEAGDAAREWRTAIEAARRSAPDLKNYVEVRYEDLLGDPEHHIAAVFDQLGIASTSDDLAASVREAKALYNVDPTSPRAEAGKWRAALSPDVLASVTSEAGALLAELGYEEGEVPTRAPAPATATPSRSLTRRLTDKLRSRGTSGAIPMHIVAKGQQLMDRFLEAVVRDPRRIEAMLASSAHIRIVDGLQRWEGRGADAVARLVQTLASDDVLRGRQVAGYMHPAALGISFIGAFESEGRTEHRVFVLAYDDETISWVSYYRFADAKA